MTEETETTETTIEPGKGAGLPPAVSGNATTPAKKTTGKKAASKKKATSKKTTGKKAENKPGPGRPKRPKGMGRFKNTHKVLLFVGGIPLRGGEVSKFQPIQYINAIAQTPQVKVLIAQGWIKVEK